MAEATGVDRWQRGRPGLHPAAEPKESAEPGERSLPLGGQVAKSPENDKRNFWICEFFSNTDGCAGAIS